jgi:hypothetical protein
LPPAAPIYPGLDEPPALLILAIYIVIAVVAFWAFAEWRSRKRWERRRKP